MFLIFLKKIKNIIKISFLNLLHFTKLFYIYTMKITIIGTGNVAFHLTKRFKETGCAIAEIHTIFGGHR